MNPRFSALAIPAAFVAFASPIARAQLGDRILRTEAVIDASPADLWKALTTKEGWESWAVPIAEVEFRIGGTIRTNYDKDAGIGGKGTIVHYILAYEPERMLTTKFVAPGNAGWAKIAEATWTIYRLEPIELARTRLVITMAGWGQGKDWDTSYDHFKSGNELTIARLQKKFERPDAAASTEATFKFLGTLIGGDWIHENTAGGKPFRVRNRFEPGPEGNSIASRGWLGDDSGMLLHSSAQIWREPGAGRVMFQDVNQNGDIARGEIRATDANTLSWDWSVATASGDPQRYTVAMRFDGTSAYQSVITQLLPDGSSKEVLNARFTRVAEAPAAFLKMRDGSTPAAAPAHATDIIDLSKFVARGMLEPGLVKEATVNAPPAEVFKAWTTPEGLKSFLGVESNIDLRIGGPFEIYFGGPEVPADERGSNGCQILSYIPNEMLAFTWNAPPKYPEARAKRAWVVLTFKPEGKSQTRVRLVHTGFGKDGQWNEVRAYFDSAWGRVLDALVDAYK